VRKETAHTISEVGRLGKFQKRPVRCLMCWLAESATDCSVLDGQTLVIGALDNGIRPGQGFKKESPEDLKKSVIIFMKPGILDSAGNETFSFTPEGIPVQPKRSSH